ncbi:alpha-galactosidase [Microbacterium sp. zg.Y1090]|uniref:glycoside hydrolase family 36 protein n=1 Tax=Microbacterium wangruii TaxID=3049073 RepID=UPI00214CE2FA|nr:MULTISPECIES: glycoside hydrolase family 36 protein [unclassified Microbacterium]MCR2817331.1 alpha-galactosidase [Microbacterium sp. zg.Y1090]WIM29181.1 alpha-galactosidase [Microbacterium sp. zg-Y1090]
MTVIDEVPVSSRAQVYAEGWQSWSPTGWYRRDDVAPRPAQTWEHLMRFRPGASVAAHGAQGEGLLLVDPGDGSAARVYCAVDATVAVPSIRATWRDEHVVVDATGAVRCWEVGGDAGPGPGDGAGAGAGAGTNAGAAALAAVGARIGAAAGARTTAVVPRVWCTWYRYFEAVTAADVRENLRAIDALRLPVDVIQIDDGWSLGTGEWTAPKPAFGSLGATVDAIRHSGRRAGLWLAPFTVGASSGLARRHPDWLTGPAGRNWGDDLVGLDLTHPGVSEYLTEVFTCVRDTGVDYLKLDFLYGGAVPGVRRDRDASAISAYRRGLQLIREVMGEGAYLLGCGAPLLPSVGLVDAMRISPDTFHEGGEDGSQGLRGRTSLRARAWQHGRLWTTDPDCLVARPQFALREEWAREVFAAPGVRGFSDRIDELDERGIRLVRQLLQGAPE